MINKIQEVASGLRIGTSHVIIFMKYEIVLKSLKIIGLYKIDSIDHAGELKVIGVGYGRTGTVSCLYGPPSEIILSPSNNLRIYLHFARLSIIHY